MPRGLYGRLPADPLRPRLVLRDYLTGQLPAHSPSVDYLGRLSGWKMLGNGPDPENAAAGVPPGGAGVCASVTWANTRRLVTATLTAERYPPLNEVIELYRSQNPDFPDQDGGMVVAKLLDHLVKVGGPDGVKALGHATVDHANVDEVKLAIEVFGSVWVGLDVRQINEDEFDAGEPWDYDPMSPDAGLHAILVGGFGLGGEGALAGDERGITWAQETSLTDAFWRRQVDEVHVVIWPEHLGSRRFLESVDLEAFARDYELITGRPFPAPVPPPVPPTPDPVSAIDRALAAVAHPWVNEHHRGHGDAHMAAALRTWLAIKDL